MQRTSGARELRVLTPLCVLDSAGLCWWAWHVHGIVYMYRARSARKGRAASERKRVRCACLLQCLVCAYPSSVRMSAVYRAHC